MARYSLGIQHLMLRDTADHELQYTRSHPERIKSKNDWTADDQGIYMADQVAGEQKSWRFFTEKSLSIPSLRMLKNSLVLLPQKTSGHGCLISGFLMAASSGRRHHLQQYLIRRDMGRIHQNDPSRWTVQSWSYGFAHHAKKLRSAEREDV